MRLLLLLLLLLSSLKLLGQAPKNTSSDTTASDSSKSITSYLKNNFHGTGYIEGRYSNWQDTLSMLPNNYLRLHFQPTFSLYDIPIKGQIFYSTEDGPVENNMKNISFTVDYAKLQQIIRQRVMKEMAEQKGKLLGQHNKKPDLASLDSLQSLPDSQRADLLAPMMGRFEQMDSLELGNYRDSVKAYHPERLQQFDSLQQIRKLVSLPKPDFENALDTMKLPEGKADELKELRKRHQLNLSDIRKPDLDYRSLYDKDLISPAERLVLSFRKFSIGDAYPMYSKFTLNGIRIKGIDLGWQPSSFIASVSAGQTTQLRYRSISEAEQVRKNVMAARIGYSKDKGHIAFSFARFSGAQDSTFKGMILHNDFAENTVAATEFELNTRRLRLSGELAASHVKGIHELVYNDEVDAARPGIAAEVGLTYFDSLTKSAISGQINRVQKNFYTYGNPFLRTDLMQYKLEWEKSFLKKKIILETFLIQEQNNLDGESRNDTRLTSPGGVLTVQFPRKPFLVVSYQPFQQFVQSEVDSFFFQSSYKTLMVQSGHQYYISGALFFTGLNYIEQNQNYSEQLAPTRYRTLYLSQLVQLSRKMELQLNGGYIFTDFNGKALRYVNADGKLSYKIGKKTTLAAGYAKIGSPYATSRQIISGQFGYQTTKKSRWLLTCMYIDRNNSDATRQQFFDFRAKYQFAF